MISLFKILKFGIVGFSGMLIDFAITYLCKEKFRINKYIANTLGFTFAVVHNFILNKIWTFETVYQDWKHEFLLFIFFSVLGLALNSILIFIMTGKLKMNFYVAKAIAIIIVFFWNYGLNNIFNFKAKTYKG